METLDVSHILAGVSLPATHTGRILHVNRTRLAKFITSQGEDVFIQSFADQLNAQWKKERFNPLPDGIATHEGDFDISFQCRHCTLLFRAFVDVGDAYIVEYTCTKTDNTCDCCLH